MSAQFVDLLVKRAPLESYFKERVRPTVWQYRRTVGLPSAEPPKPWAGAEVVWLCVVASWPSLEEVFEADIVFYMLCTWRCLSLAGNLWNLMCVLMGMRDSCSICIAFYYHTGYPSTPSTQTFSAHRERWLHTFFFTFSMEDRRPRHRCILPGKSRWRQWTWHHIQGEEIRLSDVRI